MSQRSGSDAVVITGVGVISPLGHSAKEIAARFCAGESAMQPLTGMDVDAGVGAVVADLPLEIVPADKRARIGRLDRLCRLCLSAAYAASESAGLEIGTIGAERVGLSLGTGLGCLLTNAEYNQKIVQHGPGAASPRLFAYTVSNAAAGEVSIALGIKGANVTMHAGLAAGLQAIGYGVELLRTGKADVVFAGGADALGAALVRGLADMGLLRPAAGSPFNGCTPGICPSEGAAVVVLERGDQAQRRGARCWARIGAVAAGFEPTLTRRTREPTALVETLRRALDRSGHDPKAVDLVATSAHGTALDETERRALAATFDAARPPLVLAPKAALGESFGAAGALSVVLAGALMQSCPRVTGDIAWNLDGSRLAAPAAQARLREAQVALVHALCYSGPTVALVLGRGE